jgi:DNA polymerase-1
MQEVLMSDEVFDEIPGEPVTDLEGLNLTKPDGEYTLINPEDIPSLLKILESEEIVALDTETTGLDPLTNEIVGISLSAKDRSGYYLKISTLLGSKPLLGYLSTHSFVFHNAKFDLQFLWKYDITPKVKADTMIMAYMYDADISTGLKERAALHLGYKMTTFEEMTAGLNDIFMQSSGDKGRVCSDVSASIDKPDIIKLAPLPSLVDYAAADADMTRRLYHWLLPKIRSYEVGEVYSVDLALIPVIARMELQGVPCSREILESYKEPLQKAIDLIKEKVFKMAGAPFELDSQAQVGKFL